MDYFKIWLSIVLIFHHATEPYKAEGVDRFGLGLGATTPVTSALLRWFQIVNSAYFMAGFFFIAGFLLPRSLAKRGPRGYVVNRLVRLAIPVVAFTLGFMPLLEFLVVVLTTGDAGSYNYATREFHLYHLWFMVVLLAFSLLVVLVWTVQGRQGTTSYRRRRQRRHRPPRFRDLLILVLVITTTSFNLRVFYPTSWPYAFNVAHLPQYLVMFLLGIRFARHGWLTRVSRKTGYAWLAVGIGGIFTFPLLVTFVAGGNPNMLFFGPSFPCLAYTFWDSFTCVGLCVGIVVWIREHASHSRPVVETISENTYYVYLIHYFFVVLVQVALEGITLHPFAKFLIVGTAATVGAFLASQYLIRRPWLAIKHWWQIRGNVTTQESSSSELGDDSKGSGDSEGSESSVARAASSRD